MTTDPQELRLDQSYEFDVVVVDDDTRYAGHLSLSPRKITMRVMGQPLKDGDYPFAWHKREILKCTDFNGTLLLLGIKQTSGSHRVIERHPEIRSYFECHFDIQAVIRLPPGKSVHASFSGIKFRSPVIESWIGDTETQERIGQNYGSRPAELIASGGLVEISVEVGDVGRLHVAYNASSHYSPHEFSTGIHFPPALYFIFSKLKSSIETVSFVESFYSLLALITGGELDLTEVGLLNPDFGLSHKASLYFPRSKYPDRARHGYVLFPLGHNLRHDSFGLPSLPSDIFFAYFSLGKRDRKLVEKYVRYRRLQHTEEKFLGYFRVLEALTHKKAYYLDAVKLDTLIARAERYLTKVFSDSRSVKKFLHRLPRFNESKYSTEMCIAQFFDSLPSDETSKWRFGKSNLGDICKLRNNISHANDYDVDDQTIFEMTIFVEVMLVFALFIKLGVAPEALVPIVRRMRGYHFVSLPPAPVTAEVPAA